MCAPCGALSKQCKGTNELLTFWFHFGFHMLTANLVILDLNKSVPKFDAAQQNVWRHVVFQRRQLSKNLAAGSFRKHCHKMKTARSCWCPFAANSQWQIITDCHNATYQLSKFVYEASSITNCMYLCNDFWRTMSTSEIESWWKQYKVMSRRRIAAHK